jgi:hypothetical protein
MTSTRKQNARADQLTQTLFGAANINELVRSQHAPFDDFSPRHAARIIDGAGSIGGTDIALMLQRWREEDALRTKPGGRPSRVSMRSMLILWLMHAIAHKPLTVKQFATTVSLSLSVDQMEVIGLTDDGAETNDWYQSISTAKNAVQRLVDPYAFPLYARVDPSRPEVVDRINRHRVLTGAKRQKLHQYWEDNAEWKSTPTSSAAPATC